MPTPDLYVPCRSRIAAAFHHRGGYPGDCAQCCLDGRTATSVTPRDYWTLEACVPAGGADAPDPATGRWAISRRLLLLTHHRCDQQGVGRTRRQRPNA